MTIACTRPPFRADHVGSLLRPRELLEARYAEGDAKPSADALRALEDRYVPEAIALQEQVGLQSITDGEFRRASFRSLVVSRIEGIRTVPQDAVWAARDEDGHSHPLGDAPVAVAKLRRSQGIATDEFAFLKEHTARTPKICLPAPSYHYFYRKPEPTAYAADEEYLEDLVRIAAREPRRLEPIRRLIDDLRQTPEGRAIVNDELFAVWNAVEVALETRAHA